MHKIFYASSLVAMIASFSVHADSILRIKCDDKDIGTEVFLNGKFVGNCPVDAPAKEGTVELRARKAVDGDYEQLFKKELRVVEGVPQRIELIMSSPQLTAEAKRRKEIAEASNQLRVAEAGDIYAMRKIAEYYDTGMGVEKNPSKAKLWFQKADQAAAVIREKDEVVAAQALLRGAEAGDITAMKGIAERYDTGRGINKNSAQAQAWRDKADALNRERLAQIKAQHKQQKLDNISYFEITKLAFDVDKGVQSAGSLYFTTAPISTVYALAFDLTSAPTNTSEIQKIKNEASLRPSTWGKPDSMIARASQQYNENNYTAENPILIAATK